MKVTTAAAFIIFQDVAPDMFRQLHPGDDPVLVQGHVMEDVEFLLGEVDRILAEQERPVLDVHHEIVDRDGVVLKSVLSAQDRLHPGLQFEQRKRFGEVIIGTQVESGDLIVDGTAGGDENESGIFPAFLGFFQKLKPAGIRQADVEQDEVIRVDEDFFRCAFTAESHIAMISLLGKEDLDLVGKLAFVFYDQYFHPLMVSERSEIFMKFPSFHPMTIRYS